MYIVSHVMLQDLSSVFYNFLDLKKATIKTDRKGCLVFGD